MDGDESNGNDEGSGQKKPTWVYIDEFSFPFFPTDLSILVHTQMTQMIVTMKMELLNHGVINVKPSWL
jgi:hypothetical protein